MKLIQGDLLTLKENCKYCVVASVLLNNLEYAYLINIDNYYDNMIVQYDDHSVEVVTDQKLINVLWLEFNKQVKNID